MIPHEYDREFLSYEDVEWVSPRYLRFNSERLMLIDVETMKASFPTPDSEAGFHARQYRFDPTFRWALYQVETDGVEALYLAPVVRQ